MLEITSCLNAYFAGLKDEIIGAMWSKAFDARDNDEVLLNTIQWFIIDVSLFQRIRRKVEEPRR